MKYKDTVKKIVLQKYPIQPKHFQAIPFAKFRYFEANREFPGLLSALVILTLIFDTLPR